MASDRLERTKAEIRLGDLARLSGDLDESRLHYQSALNAIQELQPQTVESLPASLSVEQGFDSSPIETLSNRWDALAAKLLTE
jgi:hypothetical protein